MDLVLLLLPDCFSLRQVANGWNSVENNPGWVGRRIRVSSDYAVDYKTDLQLFLCDRVSTQHCPGGWYERRVSPQKSSKPRRRRPSTTSDQNACSGRPVGRNLINRKRNLGLANLRRCCDAQKTTSLPRSNHCSLPVGFHQDSRFSSITMSRGFLSQPSCIRRREIRVFVPCDRVPLSDCR